MIAQTEIENLKAHKKNYQVSQEFMSFEIYWLIWVQRSENEEGDSNEAREDTQSEQQAMTAEEINSIPDFQVKQLGNENYEGQDFCMICQEHLT